MILRVSRQPPPIVYNDPPTTAFDVELELQSTTIASGAAGESLLCVSLEYDDSTRVENQQVLTCKKHAFANRCTYQTCSVAVCAPTDGDRRAAPHPRLTRLCTRLHMKEVSSRHRGRGFRLRCFVTCGASISPSVCTTAFRVLSKDPAKRKRGGAFVTRQAERRAVSAAQRGARDAAKAAREAAKAVRVAVKAAREAAVGNERGGVHRKRDGDQPTARRVRRVRPCDWPDPLLARPLYHFTLAELHNVAHHPLSSSFDEWVEVDA